MTQQNSYLQKPRIQSNLIYVPDWESDSYIVKEPMLVRFFRFSAPVVHVAQLLDGTQSIADISQNTGLEQATVRIIVTRLGQAHLLDSGLSETEIRQALETKQKQHQPRFNPARLFLFHRKLINPDKFIETVYHRLRLKYLFRPWVGILLLLTYLAAYIVYTNETGVMINALDQLWNPEALWLYWPIWGGLAILHELAHGFACKHFGGKVCAIGIGLYYFQPLFYCDVSDAWLFSKRYQRLITHSAGLLMNLFLASLAVFSLPFLPNNSNLTIIASWVFVISGIKSLLNLNPLIRLDGYFLLADLLRIDNLRIRAFGSFFLRVRHLLYYSRLVQHPPPPLPRHRSKHERWALIPYALLSLTYIVAIISFFGYRGGQWLSSYIGFWGWLVALGVAGIFLISPLWQGWQGSEQTENITSSYINTIV